MPGTRRISRIAALATTLLFAAPALVQAQEIAIEEGGAVIHLDNDLFAPFSGAGSDRDYSWGATLTFGSPRPGSWFAPVDRARRNVASLLPEREAAVVSRASQVGIIAMTPDDLKSRAPQHADRPYASLVFLTSSELRVAATGDRSRFTSLTVGVLGSGVAESMQRAVHEVQGGIVPKGWDHEISEGGEPTARFVHAEQWLLGDTEALAGGLHQTKFTVAGSAGYLTEASAAVSLRWGRFHTPWWSFNPELGDYSTAPIAPVNGFGFGASPEIYGFVGARVKARAYNALLQGQFRHSDVRVASDDLARFQAEAWAGVTSVISNWHVTYSVHVGSREIAAEPAARSLVWARLSFARAF
ncbi:MAG: lipid A-modifier LpxR family protein [Steroidobacteraceae bacterium]